MKIKRVKSRTKQSKDRLALYEMFAREYLVDFNGCAALRRCGRKYNSSAVERNTAARLIAKDYVQQIIQRQFMERTRKAEVNVEDVLRELQIMAHFDPSDLYDENQCLRRIQDMPLSVRKNIASIECDEIWEYNGKGKDRERVQVGVTKKVRLWPKDRGVEMLGKYLAMFVERQRHEDPDGNALPAVQVHVHPAKASPISDAMARLEVPANV